MAESAVAAKRRMRRIPQENRKRNAQSCDRCRKRRCKCVPSSNGTTCLSCQEHNAICSYDAPRKTRFYGSIDDLSDRYQLLEAIVKGAFPDERLTTANDLINLGQSRGYELPDLSDPKRQQASLEDLIGVPPSDPAGPSFPAFRQSIPFRPAISSPSSRPKARSSSEEPSVSLVWTTTGNPNYIGPTGTYTFFTQLRNLVQASLQDHQTNPYQSSLGTVPEGREVPDFVKDDTVKALEVEQKDEDGTPAEPSQDSNTPNSDGLTPRGDPSPGSLSSSATSREWMDRVLRQFPSEKPLEALINSFFDNVHADFPLFHRSHFLDDYQAFIVEGRQSSDTRRTGTEPRASTHMPLVPFIGCLHIIIVFGSIFDSSIQGVDHASLRLESVKAARAWIPHLIFKCTLGSVQALLLLSLYLHNNHERNAAWNLVGLAIRTSFALGLHRADTKGNFRHTQLEERKRVFCTLFAFEMFLASSLGRPSGLQELDVDIVPPKDSVSDAGGAMDNQLLSLSLKLLGILSRTRMMPLPETRDELREPVAWIPTLKELFGSLHEWKKDLGRQYDIPWIKNTIHPLPENAQSVSLEGLKDSLFRTPDAQKRPLLLMHIQYHYIAIMVTRLVLLRDVELTNKANAKIKPSLTFYANESVKHATQLGNIVLLLDDFKIINGQSGLDVFYAYCAAMVLILRLMCRAEPLSPAVKRDNNNTSGTSAGAEFPEDTILTSIKDLVNRLQDVMRRVPKGGSMERFSTVTRRFAEAVNNPNMDESRLESINFNPPFMPQVPFPSHHSQHPHHHHQQQQQQPVGGIPMGMYTPTPMYQNLPQAPYTPDLAQMTPYGHATQIGTMYQVMPDSTFGASDFRTGPIPHAPDDVTMGYPGMEFYMGQYGQ